MKSTKVLKIFLLTSLVITSLLYTVYPRLYMDDNAIIEKYSKAENFMQYLNGTEDYLLNTPGCYIPNYIKTIKITEEKIYKKSCGIRAVSIKKFQNDSIMFQIDETKMKRYSEKKYSCCFKFGSPANISGALDYTKLSFSKCKDFVNGTKTYLKEEVITVICRLDTSKKQIIYEDAYAILKKINKAYEKHDGRSWNMLILGMDTMSRARAYKSMPKTVDYMLKNNWLDYRGYQKVGYNTFPNVVSLMTGSNVSKIYKSCSNGMDKCNHLLIWSEFKKKGYVTATGEDYLRLPDTFHHYGYKSPPTDHYLRPLFLTGENIVGNIVCTKKRPSAKNIFDYAATFAENYKYDKFFGMFWINSYSHNLQNVPTIIDNDIVIFFEHLNKSGVMNNTFVLFLSDHGIRYGKMRESYESYYEERLPMLFMWIPEEFRRVYSEEYMNLKINQNRLITPYDIYITMLDIMSKSNSSTENKSDGCPNCMSIFNEISPNRSCRDANVDEKWCTCHKMEPVSLKSDNGTQHSLDLAVSDLQTTMRSIKTTSCKTCIVLKLKSVLRTHRYHDISLNSTYYVLAFVMTPGDVGYEATVVERNGTFTIILPTNTISTYNTRGTCVLNRNDQSYCVCEKINKCKIKR